MLHELLLALHGISGGIFVQSDKTEEDDDLGLDQHLIPISNNLPFVPHGELVLYAELLKLGTCYKYLQEFIERFSESYHGLYLSAFALGIDDSLKAYRTDLCTLETELLMDADLGVSHISYRLHSYKILLPVLVKVTKKVENIVTSPQTTGVRSSCRLLDTILSAAPPGLPGPRFTIQKFSIKLAAAQSNKLSENITVLDRLHLCIIAPPVFERLFSPNICRAYDRLFRFLFAIRRTQLKLQEFWADQILLWRRTSARNQLHVNYNKAPINVFIQLQSCIDQRLLVRSHMAFIIDSLQYYLQVDVIEAQFSHLIRRLHIDQEIRLIQIAQEAYLAGLQAQALLFMPDIKLCILQLLNYCCQFVDLSNQQYYYDHLMNMDDDHNHQLSDKVQEMVNKFYTQAKLLYDLLNISCSTGAKSSVGFNSGYTVVNHHRDFESLSLPGITTTNGPHYSGTTDLNKLLSRLDFNYFYSDSLENLI